MGYHTVTHGVISASCTDWKPQKLPYKHRRSSVPDFVLKGLHRKLPRLSGSTLTGPLNKCIGNKGSKGPQKEQYMLIMKVNVNIEVYINRYKIKF